ncbi:MAG TPA: HAMP domain-containing histidine kinase, partial [Candidatus Acetothermia bacterium]|nr:HAMP domain-containing histidine kinase [Candidatus Acetothermia bacterium]
NLEAMLDGVFPLSQESLAPVYEETLQLAELVEDLRELTLAEAGKLPLQREPLDLGQLAERVCEAIRPVAAEEGIHLELELGRGLVVEADPKRIRQVLGNILANALRYSPAGGTVSVSVRREGNGAVVTVRDQGPGIPPEDLPHIFERFYKGDPARSGQGSGLGLAIAKAIVEAHGGRIWAESRLGEGTAVSFSLPLRGGGSSGSA